MILFPPPHFNPSKIFRSVFPKSGLWIFKSRNPDQKVSGNPCHRHQAARQSTHRLPRTLRSLWKLLHGQQCGGCQVCQGCSRRYRGRAQTTADPRHWNHHQERGNRVNPVLQSLRIQTERIDGDPPRKLHFLRLATIHGEFARLRRVFFFLHIQSGPFIWVTSKYLGSCWSYQKTKATLLYQTTHSASTEQYFSSLGETFVKKS